jgi:MFS family permease
VHDERGDNSGSSPATADTTDDRASVWEVPGFRTLFVSSWLWHTTRWGGLFTCGYLVTKLSDAPFLNQLVGVSIFAPMLLGGLAAGALSDRFDRRRIVLTTQLLLIPVSLAMFAIVQSGLVQVWMVYPYMICLGSGGVVNMTAQRALIYETVGARLAPRALTIETVGMASANVAGALCGGAAIEAIGTGSAFGLLATALCVSVVLLRTVPAPKRGAEIAPTVTSRPTVIAPIPVTTLPSTTQPSTTQPSTTQPSTPQPSTPPPSFTMRDQIRSGFTLLDRSPSLTSMLGITVVMNLFYFSFMPLVPVMAERFGASALSTGILGAAAGCGQLVTGIVLASRHVTRRGHVYVAGSAIALTGLGLFASAPALGVAFVALLFAGVGQAGFGSMQSVLVIESASRAERGAALGLLSTAIGAMPLGMLLVGFSAQSLGPPMALRVSSAVGLAALMLWLHRSPHVLGPAREPAEAVTV